MADRVAVMSRGRLEQVSPAIDIYDAPRTLFVNQFVGTTNAFQATVEHVDNGTLVARLSSGERVEGTSPDRSSPVVGAAVTVSIRPEQLRLADGEARNAVAGVIANALPLGPIVLYDIRREDGSTFKVSMPREGGDLVLAAGTTIAAVPTGHASYRFFAAANEAD